MTTKYHYEVYQHEEPTGNEPRFNTYEEAKKCIQDREDNGENVNVYGIDKHRTVYPNFVDLPTAKTYEEARECIEKGGRLWTVEVGDDLECLSTDNLDDLHEEIQCDDDEKFNPLRYHIDNGEPTPERLGECVGDDLDAPMNCEVCDKDLWKGDIIYVEASGYIDDTGYPEADQGESYGATCPGRSPARKNSQRQTVKAKLKAERRARR